MSLQDTDSREGYRAPSVHTEASDGLHSTNKDTYQDLLVEAAPNNHDNPMPDILGQHTGATRPREDIPAIIKEEESDSEFLWAKMQEHTIELADSETDSDFEEELVTKKEPKEPRTFINDAGDRVIELLDSDDEGFVIPVKEEPREERFDWKQMPTTFIDLSDVGNGVSSGGTVPTPRIKQEEPEVPFNWSCMGNAGVIELLDSDEEDSTPQRVPSLGNSFLRGSTNRGRRPPMDPEQRRQAQREYAARAWAGRRDAGGATGMFNIPHPSTAGDASQAADGNAWMRDVPREPEDRTSDFAEIKRQYKAKRKAKRATIQDDITFKKAQDAEKVRLRKLESRINQMDSSEEEAEESDDGLFIPDSTPPPASRGADDLGAAGHGEGRRGKGPKSKKQKTTDKPKRTKAELRSELYYNLMAGYEEEAARDKKKEEHEAMYMDKESRRDDRRKKKAQKNPNAKHTHELMKGKKPGKKSKAKAKAPGATVRALKTSNIYDDSNANSLKFAMPAMQGKEKRKAMVDLIASIPLEESKKAQLTGDRTSVSKATVVLGNCKVNDSDVDGEGDWNLRGMNTPLFHHQVLGAAAMKERETGEAIPQGGILADEMGFGKTLMSLATVIVNGPAPTEEQRCTLIICSPAILSQWDDEMNKHTKAGILGSIIRHHGHTRVSSKGASGRNAIGIMEKAGVVLSTYSEVVKSYPRCAIPEDLKSVVDKMAWWKQEWEKERGLLHRVQFYRVILDEAHVIKNHQSYTSIACRALMAKHRWAVTGTPIQNCLDELYAYFRFLRIPFTTSYRIFKYNFCEPKSKVANQRLHSYLDHIMIRRTHRHELFGTSMVKLPENHQMTKPLTFNNIERKIYDTIKKKFVLKVNGMLSNSGCSTEERSRTFLLLILRLRQMTSHLFMLQETMEELFDIEDIENLWSATADETSPSAGDCTNMAKALREMIKAKDDKPEAAAKGDTAKQSQKKGKNESDTIYKFRRYLRSLRDGDKWEELKDRSRCHRCKLPPDEPMLTSCMHLYCSECLKALSYEAAELDEDHTKCLKCNKPFTSSSPCVGLKELEADTIPAAIPPDTPTAKGRVVRDRADPGRPSRTVNDHMKWLNMDGHILPSTKTAAVIVQIGEWLKDFPTQKIIVFSQFHTIFQVLGKQCEQEKWKYCQYHGKMSHKAREEAVENFRDDPEMMILIASLKCGGIGLNLTMASRVICVDLWFNSSVEQQAFCRVLRIGQKLETHITRFFVKDSIDEDLIKMQDNKTAVISAAMDDRTVLAQLSLEELMSLFGEVRYGANHTPFIYVEENVEKNWGPMKENEVVEVMEDDDEAGEEEVEAAED